ncbi:MAG: hypothetical protein JNK77_20195 [Saprospiraceae bacterium]|nr:hypothetical protein [Saprospiraceae bacterium]
MLVVNRINEKGRLRCIVQTFPRDDNRIMRLADLSVDENFFEEALQKYAFTYKEAIPHFRYFININLFFLKLVEEREVPEEGLWVVGCGL